MTRSTLRGATADLIDTDRYPLSRPDSAAWAAVVERVRADLRLDGCSVLRGFVPGDRIPEGGLVSRLHRAPETQRFVAACVDVPEVVPLAGPCLDVLSPGQEHPWHFDTDEFAVTLLTRAPEGGGVFEYVPGIRTASDENPYAVGAVLHGEHDRVRSLRLRAGDLQIFRGRYSLHRVTAVTGAVERHATVLSYTERTAASTGRSPSSGSRTGGRELLGQTGQLSSR